MVFAGPALADGKHHHKDNDREWECQKHDPVPEIDPGSATSAMMLLTGGMLLLA
jgi:hypothetical protein